MIDRYRCLEQSVLTAAALGAVFAESPLMPNPAGANRWGRARPIRKNPFEQSGAKLSAGCQPRRGVPKKVPVLADRAALVTLSAADGGSAG